VFLTPYNRTLLLKMAPLLKNHLIPRIQAMIILGQSANPDALKLFEDQIKDDKQTIWVKLWALEGMANIAEEGQELTGHRLTASNQIDAGKVIADFLNNEDDIPWPAQLRALEALGAMRQGYRPSAPKEAEMASAAMRMLVDRDNKPEVRAEAARALGLMQTTAVPRYNHPLVAYATGQFVAELGSVIGSSFSNNPVKSRYLTVILVGPVYEAFNGVEGKRESGLVPITSAGDSGSYVSAIFELFKPIAKAATDLLVSPSRQVPDRQKDLAAKVAALRQYLSKNPPRSRSLVQGGREFPIGEGTAGALPGSSPLAGQQR
jgi:hypothetical protein